MEEEECCGGPLIYKDIKIRTLLYNSQNPTCLLQAIPNSIEGCALVYGVGIGN